MAVLLRIIKPEGYVIAFSDCIERSSCPGSITYFIVAYAIIKAAFLKCTSVSLFSANSHDCVVALIALFLAI